MMTNIFNGLFRDSRVEKMKKEADSNSVLFQEMVQLSKQYGLNKLIFFIIAT